MRVGVTAPCPHSLVRASVCVARPPVCDAPCPTPALALTFHLASRAALNSPPSNPLAAPSTAQLHCVLPVARARRPHFCTMKKASSTMEVSGEPATYSSMSMAVRTFCSI